MLVEPYRGPHCAATQLVTPRNYMSPLHDAIAHRAAALAAHAADAEALARGRERLAAAQAELDRLTTDDAEAITRHARRLAEQTRGGYSGPVPVLVPTDAALVALATAQRTHVAAVQMISSLEASELASRHELAAADQAVRAAEIARETELVRRLDAKRTQILQDVDSLTEMIAVVMIDTPGAVPADVDQRCNEQINLLTIESALQLSRHIVRDINTPLGTRHAAIAAARQRLDKFREEIQMDDDASSTERAA
jgi:hypothetical protein